MTLKQSGKAATRLDPGSYNLIINDSSPIAGMQIKGPNFLRTTSVKKRGTFRFKVHVATSRIPGVATYK